MFKLNQPIIKNKVLTRLSTFASKTPAVAGVLLIGLHYTVDSPRRQLRLRSSAGAGRATSVRADPAESPDPASVRHSAAGRDLWGLVRQDKLG